GARLCLLRRRPRGKVPCPNRHIFGNGRGRRSTPMQNIRPATPKGDQSCPICGAQLAAGALQCESCGTDLSKSGVLFGTQVRPATLLRRRRLSKLLKPAVLRPAAVVVVLAGLIGLGGVPAAGRALPVPRALH